MNTIEQDREKAAEQLANELRIPVLDPADERDLLTDSYVLAGKSVDMRFIDPVIIASFTSELLQQPRWKGREEDVQSFGKRLAEELREGYLSSIGANDEDDEDEVDDDGLLAGQYPLSHGLFMTAVRLRNAGHTDENILQTLNGTKAVKTLEPNPLDW